MFANEHDRRSRSGMCFYAPWQIQHLLEMIIVTVTATMRRLRSWHADPSLTPNWYK